MPKVIDGQLYLTAGDIGQVWGATRHEVLAYAWRGSLPWPDITKPTGTWLWKADPFVEVGLVPFDLPYTPPAN